MLEIETKSYTDLLKNPNISNYSKDIYRQQLTEGEHKLKVLKGQEKELFQEEKIAA